jgi:predicted dinucleotide-binding enzyme
LEVLMSAEARTQHEAFDVSAAAAGVEISDARTGRVLLTVPHGQVTDLIKQLVDAQGDALVATVREVRDAGVQR